MFRRSMFVLSSFYSVFSVLLRFTDLKKPIILLVFPNSSYNLKTNIKGNPIQNENNNLSQYGIREK